MNHSPSGSLFLSKAIPGFINYKTAEGLALRTIDSHERLLNKWLEHIGDQEIGKITAQDVVAYLSWLRNEYTPRRYNGKTHPLSPKSLRNVWVTLSSFYSWASQELGVNQIMKSVPAPRIKKTSIEPLTQDEVQRMLKACVYSLEVRPSNRRSFTMRLRFSHRDQAIILTLIDTGLRAMELCKLLIGNIDLKTGRVEVKHGVIGGAKGGKGRTVYLGKTTRKAVWRYLVDREVRQALKQNWSTLEACERWHSGAYLLETMSCILYILVRYGDNPEEAIVRAVNDTKDNDTIAAIVGAAVGALHGRSRLPARWISALLGRTTADDDWHVFELIESAKQTFWRADPPLTSDNLQAVLKFLPVFEQPDFFPGEWITQEGSLPYFSYTPAVLDFIRAFSGNGFIQPFDWMNWREGEQLVDHPRCFAKPTCKRCASC